MPPLAPESAFVHDLRLQTMRVGVVGLGYVGLPLSLTVSRKFSVVGYDQDAARAKAIAHGLPGMMHVDAHKLVSALKAYRFSPSASPGPLSTCSVVIICVPTPLGPHREPVMDHVVAAARTVAANLRKGALVVLESTTYPGTTEEVVRPILEEGSGLKAGEGFFLAYSPEREDPGNADFETSSVPKVVGGLTPTCRSLAEAFYATCFDRVVPVSSLRAAEMTKLLENVFRCVNIALVNEMKMLSLAMGIDVWEVINAARSKPFGFMPFYPGPGLGGHCIPVDPYYLAWKAHEYDAPTHFIELAGEINRQMPRFVVERVSRALSDRAGKSLSGASVLVLGVAYKPDVGDVRESPAIPILRSLSRLGADVRYHDPHVPQLGERRSVPLTEDEVRAADVVLVVTHHTGVEYGLVARCASLVVDTRNVVPCGGGNVVPA